MFGRISRGWRLRKRSRISYILALILFYYAFKGTATYFATETITSSLKFARNVSLSIEPGKSTAILQPLPHSKSSCKGETGAGDDLALLIMVISHPAHQEKRSLVRDVFKEMRPFWEAHFQKEIDNAWKEGSHKINWINKPAKNVFNVLFFVGKSEDTSIMESMKSESNKHGDLVLDNFHDSYLNLTVKSLRMLKWVTMNCGGASFLLKMDDDVFIHVPKLFSFLFSPVSLKYPGTLIAGTIFDDAPAVRNPFSRWFTPEVVYPRSQFPQYAAGYAYLLGMEAARNIYSVALETPLIHLEDVFMFGLVAKEKIGYQLSALGDVWKHVYFTDLIITPADNWYTKKIAIHPVNARQFRCWTILSTNQNSNIKDECGWLMLIRSAL